MFQSSLLGVLVAGLAILVGILAPMEYLVILCPRSVYSSYSHWKPTGGQCSRTSSYPRWYVLAIFSFCMLLLLLLLWLSQVFYGNVRKQNISCLCMPRWHFIYFSRKMNRLVLLLAPAASVLAGIAISGIFTWTLVQVWELVECVLSPLQIVKIIYDSQYQDCQWSCINIV